MNRCTWNKPDGSWGIEGVNLADLPPQLYRAVMMLERLEKQVEQINAPDIQDWLREDLLHELNDMLGLKLPGIGVNLCSTQWIEKPNADVIVCSRCKAQYFYVKKYDYKYCPTCGAKMEAEIPCI